MGRAVLLTVIGVVAGLAVHGLRPSTLALGAPVLAGAGEQAGATCAPPAGRVRDLELPEALVLREQGASFVDARSATAFARGHIPGAYHLPSRGECPEAEEVIERLLAAPTVIVYDAGDSCAASRHLASLLTARGLAEVRVLLGGFPRWQDADEPAQSGSCTACATDGSSTP